MECWRGKDSGTLRWFRWEFRCVGACVSLWRWREVEGEGEKGGWGSEMEKLQGSHERSRQETETLGDVKKRS